MRIKYAVIGFVVGVSLTLSATAFAEEVSKIGKKITNEFTVMLNGEQLPVKAVGFDGTSYAPVRAVGEALGLGVDFKDGTVILESMDASNDGGEALETTFNGLRAVKADGEVYFNRKDYNDKFITTAIAIDPETQKLSIVLKEKNSTNIIKVYEEYEYSESLYIIHKGEVYVHSDYYVDPSELKSAE